MSVPVRRWVAMVWISSGRSTRLFTEVGDGLIANVYKACVSQDHGLFQSVVLAGDTGKGARSVVGQASDGKQ